MKLSLLSTIRKLFGYRMPRLGRTAHHLFFKFAPGTANVALFPGIHVSLDFSDAIQRATFWSGYQYEAPTGELIKLWADKGATRFFDMGANFGFFSLLTKDYAPAVQVVSFEPNPALHQKLSCIISENSLSAIQAIPLGLSNTEATLPLHLGIEDSGHTTFGAHPELESSATVEVNVLPFDIWREREGIPLPHYSEWIAKIDVEGFEFSVLQGMEKSLKAKAFIGLVVEINDFTLKFCHSSAQEVFDFLHTCGYRPLTEGEVPTKHPLFGTANAFFVPQ